ncbi:MAG: hypothetical protein LBQ67_03260, partial [Treponema sp.]|nr:hypothetical protein [Treponema sp.]
MNYRRLLFAGMAVLLICSFVAAQEEGIGLTPKLEFGIGNVNEGNDGSRSILITPGVEYENAFLDGALDVFAELDYTIGIPEKGDTDHLVYLEEEVGYNLGLGDAMTLSIILNNQNNFLVSPEAPSGFDPFDGVLEPSLKFTYGADFGEIWVQAGLPIGYAPFAGAYG